MGISDIGMPLSAQQSQPALARGIVRSGLLEAKGGWDLMEAHHRDQERFDEHVAAYGKLVLQTLALLGILGAVIMSAMALGRSESGGETQIATPMPVSHGAMGSTTAMPMSSATSAATSASSPAAPMAAKTVSLKIFASKKLGPDGKRHDYFTTTNFSVKVGQPLKLRIDNSDDMMHSISAPVAGINVMVQPGLHTYTIVVKRAGHFNWVCAIPCDTDAKGWAMQHPEGFMGGVITAT